MLVNEKGMDYFHLQLAKWNEIDWLWCWKTFVYSAWTIASKTIISIVVFGIMTEGLRVLVPPLSQKMFKLPFFGFFQQYEETHNLDLATLFAVGLIVAVWVLWHEVIEILLDLDRINEFSPRQVFVLTLGSIILGADAIIFSFGISEMGWGGGGVTFSSLVATAAYIALLIFSCWVSVNLKSACQTVKEKP